MASPLEDFVLSDTGCRDRESLERWQLARLREALTYARENSRFYRTHLAGVEPESLRTPEDLTRIPFTTAAQLRAAPTDWLCLGAARVRRAVTLKTSGTTAAPKRVFFTEEDLERTVAFFAHGMRELTCPGDAVAILMPADRPDSVGDLLGRGLARSGMVPVPLGPVSDTAACYRAIREHGCTCAVGIPTQVLALARYGALLPEGERVRLRSVLLSADATPPALVKTVGELLGCPVFTHFGMTEMGYGVAVDCAALTGCHIRENELLVEVVDPETGAPLPDGVQGEFVFTTLRREAMPFLRYRTGDLGMLVPGPCPCGSILRRMLPVGGRIAQHMEGLSLWGLDEVLFSCPRVSDYSLCLTPKGAEFTVFGPIPPDGAKIREKLSRLPELAGRQIVVNTAVSAGSAGTGMQKREIARGE